MIRSCYQRIKKYHIQRKHTCKRNWRNMRNVEPIGFAGVNICTATTKDTTPHAISVVERCAPMMIVTERIMSNICCFYYFSTSGIYSFVLSVSIINSGVRCTVWLYYDHLCFVAYILKKFRNAAFSSKSTYLAEEVILLYIATVRIHRYVESGFFKIGFFRISSHRLLRRHRYNLFYLVYDQFNNYN